MSNETTAKANYYRVVYSYGGGSTACTVTAGSSHSDVFKTFSRQNPQVRVTSIEDEAGSVIFYV